MAKYIKVYEIVIKKIIEILQQHKEGLEYGELTQKLFEELPEIQRNSIHGTFTTYLKKFPKNIIKPRRGFYKWIDEDIEGSDNSSLTNELIENDLSVINGEILTLHLKNFQQFNDIKLDFTYPTGHEKSGEPLKKVCFIGQSGTGKTTVLDILRYFSLSEQSKKDYPILNIDKNAEIEITYLIPNFAVVKLSYVNKSLSYEIVEKLSNVSTENFDKELYKYFESVNYKLIYFPSDVIKQLDKLNEDKQSEQYESIAQDKILDFSLLHPSTIWEDVTTEIKEYNASFANKSLEYTKSIINNPSQRKIADKELNKWLHENPNPIKQLADKCLDEFLNEFGVRVETELDKIEDIDFIKLETLNGREIELEKWSTGTKQIVMRGMSLFMLKPENSLMLFDEPENSLYPNIQNKVVGFYNDLAQNSQFIYSTHSPIIASSFEPYEIIELKYDEDRIFVAQERYYHDERNIDNYFLFPKYLTWGRILQDVFDVKEDSHPDREQKLLELAILNDDIEHLLETNKIEEAKIKQVEYEKLADLLKWEV